MNSCGHILFSLLASLFAHQSGQSLYTCIALEGCNRKNFYPLTFRKQKCLHRRGSTPVSTVLRKSVRFFITNIFFIIKNFPSWNFAPYDILYNMEINLDEIIRRFARLHPRIMNWPISGMNDSETKERGLLGVKIQKSPSGVYLQIPLGSLCLRRSFWKSVSIHSRSAPAPLWLTENTTWPIFAAVIAI